MTVLEGDVVVRRHDDGRVEILQAPPRARMSLEFLTAADPVIVKASGNRISLAGQVTYRVIGWDQHNLLLELVDDRRGPRSWAGEAVDALSRDTDEASGGP